MNQVVRCVALVGLCAILAAGNAGDIYISSLESYMSDVKDEIVSATDLYDKLTEEDLNVRLVRSLPRSRSFRHRLYPRHSLEMHLWRRETSCTP